MADDPHSPAASADLVAIAKTLYPHDGLADAPYERTVRSILDRAVREPILWHDLRDGVIQLESQLGHAVGSATEHELLPLLAARVDTPFFRAMRSLTAWYLYDDHEVWDLVGYPGGSFEHGGYLERGYNDLTWLPEPRVAENPDTMIEIGPRS